MMDHWQQHLASGWALLKQALEPLQDIHPDEIQVELYRYSFSFANLSAAQYLVESFTKLGDSGTTEYRLSEQITSRFLAKTLSELNENTRLLAPELRGLPEDSVRFMTTTLKPGTDAEIFKNVETLDGTVPWQSVSEEKDVVRASIRRFTEEVVVPEAERIHRENLMIPDSILDGVRELGCFGYSVPEEYGGLKPGDGEDTTGMVIVTEELSRGSLGAAGSLITRPEIIVRALLEGGTEAQRQRWLPGLAQGDPLCAVSVTEPNTGSDVASVNLKATQVDGGWLLDGPKTWCTFAGKAGLILVLARTDPDADPPHRGLSLFVIEKPSSDDTAFQVKSDVQGSLSGRAIPTLGYRGMHSFEMNFNDYFVREDQLVGEETGLNRGFYFTMRGFSGGRLQTAARAIGLMQAAYEAASAYAGDRQVFGQAIRDYRLTQTKLLDMLMSIVAVRRYAYGVAELMDQDAGQLEASLVKLIACRAAESVTREALQIHGGMGYAEEFSVSRYFVDARVLSIFEGAEETLALKVVGRSIFDLLNS